MKMATSQLPPGAMESMSGMNGEEGDNMPTVEVKVHMMSVPMMPPGAMPPFAPQPPSATTAAAKNDDSNTDKTSKPQTSKARFPGIFFKKKDQDSKSVTSKESEEEDEEDTNKRKNKKVKITTKGSDKLSSKLQPNVSISSGSSDEKPKRVSESEAAKELESLSGFFPELLVAPPRDHTLKVLWDRMGDAEMGKRVSRLNRRLIEKEILRTQTQLRHLPKRFSQGIYLYMYLSDVLSSIFMVMNKYDI